MEEIAFSLLKWLQDSICFCPIFIVCLNNCVWGSESKEQPSSKHNKHKHNKHKHNKHKHNKVRAVNVPILKSGHSSSFSGALIAMLTKINLYQGGLMLYVQSLNTAVMLASMLVSLMFPVQKTETHYHNCVVNQVVIIQNSHPDDVATLTKIKP